MPVARAYFTSKEIDTVLTHYDISYIEQIETLKAGNRQIPKKIVHTDRGKYLLKRCLKRNQDTKRICFAHAIQLHLLRKGFPLPGLVATHDQKQTLLPHNNYLYELFEFVEGSRFDGCPVETVNAGKTLADFHHSLQDFTTDYASLHSTFHDSSAVIRHLEIVGRQKPPNRPDDSMKPLADDLLDLYKRSCQNVNDFGFANWPEQIVHGDYHQGNLIFVEQNVVAVLDFDSVKIAPAITDIANGALQFSIVTGRPSPADWPEYLDQDKLENFIEGYQHRGKLSKEMLMSLPDQMIETMIAEAVLPVAATGFVGHLSGFDFLKMIQRKCQWINSNRQLLNKILLH